MKFSIGSKVLGLGAVALLAVGAVAQVGSAGRASQEQYATPRTAQAGKVFIPESGKETRSLYAHTTYSLHSVDGVSPLVMSAPTPRHTDGVGPMVALTQTLETPNSMGCLYVKSPTTSGCVPFAVPGGPKAAGYGAIAIVDAYDNPNASSDVTTFNAQWPLAATNFTKIYANGNGSCTKPPANAGWALEESLDIEWAHVFAPNAAIILVEACSNSYTDLFYAEQVAFNYIVTHYPAGGQVTNSWSGGEFAGQTADDPFFADYNYNFSNFGSGTFVPVLAFASAGDNGVGAGYPSTNPWLISAGGTSVYRTASNQHFNKEGCWSGSGGGVSAQETYATTFSGGNTGPWADFQYPIFGEANRVTPDLSFNADPASGVYVYSGYNGGWFAVGGTSVSSPALASIINRAGNKLGTVFYGTKIPISGGFFNAEENNLLYSQLPTALAYKTNFYDVKTGSNGASAMASYDECTGVGSPRGILGK
jgi:kumamolisin